MPEQFEQETKKEQSQLTNMAIGVSVFYVLVFLLLLASDLVGFQKVGVEAETVEAARPFIRLNEWGDLLAGLFAPLAFLWLVVGYYQQGQELKAQVAELKNSVDAATDQAKSNRANLVLRLEHDWKCEIVNEVSYAVRSLQLIKMAFVLSAVERMEDEFFGSLDQANSGILANTLHVAYKIILEYQYAQTYYDQALSEYKAILETLRSNLSVRQAQYEKAMNEVDPSNVFHGMQDGSVYADFVNRLEISIEKTVSRINEEREYGKV